MSESKSVSEPENALEANAPAEANNAEVVMGGEGQEVVFGDEVAAAANNNDDNDNDDDDDDEVTLDQIDPNCHDLLQAGFDHLEVVRTEIDALDGELPAQEGRGHPAAVRARTGLVHAVDEIEGAVDRLVVLFRREREIANAAREYTAFLEETIRGFNAR